MNRDDCERADAQDPLRAFRDRFVLPADTIYLLGNSLGALPVAAPAVFERVVRDEWGRHLIGGWNLGWYDQPVRLGDRLGRLLGAAPGQVVVSDSTSVNLMKVVHAAIARQRPHDRHSVGYDRAMFPTDVYVTVSVAEAVGARPVPLTLADGRLPDELPDDLAAVVLSHVDYRSGRLLDLAAITAAVHARSALAVWDLSHSVGAVPVHLDDNDVDYAVGCTYKYLNAGPGAPAFGYVRDRLLADTQVLPAGWFGHREPFAMAGGFTPAAGIRRLLVGTPPVISAAGLEASLDVFADVDLAALRQKSLGLTDTFVTALREREAAVDVVTPSAAEHRGSQVSLRHDAAYPVVRNLQALGVVGDFRAPDIMRFGFAPLYTRFVDAYDAAATLARVVREETWRDPAYAAREPVT